MNRLHERYQSEVIGALSKQFSYTNPNQVPRLDKIVVNVGLGEALTNAKAIDSAFGGFDKFKEQFQKAGMTRFGSGWAWLVQGAAGLTIESSPNQDCPVMDGKKVLMGCDVWEHAYYLKYQNRRAEYLGAWWATVNWTLVAKRMA